MKHVPLAIVAMLAVGSLLASAGTVTVFEGGAPEAVAVLEDPECCDFVNITLPAECHIRKATMNLSAQIPDYTCPDCPEAVQVFLDDTLLWEFNGTDYGGFGLQDAFVNETGSWRSGFGLQGGTNSSGIRLPKKAVVQNATLEINGSGPGGWVQSMNFTGAAVGDYFGMSVSNAGDVNNDGDDDVIVGAPYNSAGGSYAGRAYLFFGGAAMDSSPDVILTGEAANDYLGYSVSGAGDVNNDGYADVIVGAIGNDAGGANAGRAYIFFGGTAMDSTADVIFTGEAAGDYFGGSVSGAGDVNNDGYGDVIVGARGNDAGGANAGRAYIYFGGASTDSTADVIFTGAAATDLFAYSVSGYGDVNNDGYSDVIVGARGNDAGGTDAGAAYTYQWLPGIRDPGISVGQKNVWTHAGFFNSTNSTKDLSQVLNGYISTALPAGIDKYGIPYVYVPVEVDAKNRGNITLSELNITYNYTSPVPEFTERLSSYISAHKAYKDANGNLTVPFTVRSRTAGKVKLLDLNIITDEAPRLLRAIPNVEMDEDSMLSDSVNLWDYFEDDFDKDEQLEFGLGSATNDSIVKVEIIGNQYLSVDAAEGDQNDNWTGVVDVVVKASDTWGSTRESNPFQIMVTNVNDAPIITSEPPVKGAGAQDYRYQVVALDGDNDTLTYELTKKPDNMKINGSTGLISWIPSKWGKYNVAVTASDGTLTASQDFRISVPNRPPRVTNTTIPTAYINELYACNIQAIDDDGDTLRFSLLGQMDSMTLDASNGWINWTPNRLGDIPVSIAISDGQDTTRYDFIINVVQGNRAPRFTTTPATAAIVGLPYSYDANATDADNDALDFQSVAIPAGMAIDNATGVVSWTPAAAGNFTVKISVLDGKGGQAVQEFTVIVKSRVKAKLEVTAPLDNQKLKGKAAITGKVTKGTLEVSKLQIKIDSGEWSDIPANTTWTYTLDTTKLSNGKHTLQVRAYDGKDYSDVVNRTVTVDNAKEAGKGFIPGFGAGVIAVMVVPLALAWSWLRRKR